MTGDEFRALRQSLGLSIRKAAAELGVASSTIYRWETGRRQRIPSTTADALRAMVKRQTAARKRRERATASAPPDPTTTDE